MTTTFSKQEIIDLVDRFQSIVRSYNCVDTSMRGPGFYQYFDEESQRTIYLVTLDILLELHNMTSQSTIDSFQVMDESNLSYTKAQSCDLLVGYFVDETEEEDPTKRWIHTNMDKLPENVGYCQKDV